MAKHRSREARAVEMHACPTCKVRPGTPCVDREGKTLKSTHGPGCHPLRRKLLHVTLHGSEPETAAE